MSDENQLEEFLKVLETFETAMLVTRRDDELRSRPMAIAAARPDGRLFFITRADSGKLDEIAEHSNVNVSLQGSARFLSISGVAHTVRNRKLINELWSRMDSIWFSEGRDDPSAILLEVVPAYAEYWDRSGANAIRFTLAAAAGALRGEPPDPGQAGAHGKLRFSDKTQ